MCPFDGDSNYRATYVGHHGSAPPQIARPPPSSLQLLASEAPFDGRTNYRDEFTGRRDESGSIQQTVAPDGAASVLGSVLQLYDVHFTLFFKNYTAKKYKKRTETVVLTELDKAQNSLTPTAVRGTQTVQEH